MLSYYFDQYNHTHAFREGNGRTIQGILAVLGHQAGYQVEVSPVVAPRLNDARDLAIVRPYGPQQPAQNLEALTLLLRTALTPLPGPAAQRDPSQARPLREVSLAMQRLEALRVLQSATYSIAAALRDIDRGNYSRGNQLLQQMNHVLLDQATASQLSPQLQQAALEVSRHPILGKEAEATNNAKWLEKSVQQLVRLEQPIAKQQLTQAIRPPIPKRRRPKL